MYKRPSLPLFFPLNQQQFSGQSDFTCKYLLCFWEAYSFYLNIGLKSENKAPFNKDGLNLKAVGETDSGLFSTESMSGKLKKRNGRQ